MTQLVLYVISSGARDVLWKMSHLSQNRKLFIISHNKQLDWLLIVVNNSLLWVCILNCQCISCKVLQNWGIYYSAVKLRSTLYLVKKNVLMRTVWMCLSALETDNKAYWILSYLRSLANETQVEAGVQSLLNKVKVKERKKTFFNLFQ